MKTHLVIGLGEVGKALQNIFKCDGKDPHLNIEAPFDHYDVLHIAFPYSDIFIETVEQYKLYYKPEMVIIHSSVPIGTSEKLDSVASPIRGVHPNLEEGIRIFIKYFGGRQAEEACRIFKEKGIEGVYGNDSRSIEALKLWDTTQYGVNILLNKAIHKFCTENDVDFNIVYTDANKTYNEGYMKLGRPEVVRPYLKYMPGEIGGHCVIPNAKLLDAPIAKQIVEENNTL